jgi:hypothetical protein
VTGRGWICAALGLLFVHAPVLGQLDPEKRRLLQLGYDQPLEGRAPIAGYGFFYYNRPGFPETNINLRLAIAPVYLDSEVGFREVFSPNTDLGIGLAGGGFRDSYSEVRGGQYRRDESFTGHTAELSSSVYHRLNPDWRVPAWVIARGAIHRAMYNRDSDTAADFEIPRDLNTFIGRAGLRVGGREPSLTSPLAFEMSLWYEAHLRERTQRYGFDDDRMIERASHLFWGRTFLKYTFEESQQYFDVGLLLGASVGADRLSAFRMGGFLPYVAEFPLNIPGYYYQEISAEKFGLLNGEYSFPFTPNKNWRFSVHGAGALVDNLDTHAEAGQWHAGVGAGVTYVSPRGAWLVSLVYGHGFQAVRHNESGANNVGILFQYDFDATKKFPYRRFEPSISPYSSRGGERIFR